jgi:hypothetical protein
MFSKQFFQSIDQRVEEYRQRIATALSNRKDLAVSVIVVTPDANYALCGVLFTGDETVVVLYYGAPSMETVDSLEWDEDEQSKWSALAIPYEHIRAVHFTAVRPDDNDRIGFRGSAPAAH